MKMLAFLTLAKRRENLASNPISLRYGIFTENELQKKTSFVAVVGIPIPLTS
jgi:hypothetical protein